MVKDHAGADMRAWALIQAAKTDGINSEENVWYNAQLEEIILILLKKQKLYRKCRLS